MRTEGNECRSVRNRAFAFSFYIIPVGGGGGWMEPDYTITVEFRRGPNGKRRVVKCKSREGDGLSIRPDGE